jgi:hypothetical protein
VSLRAFPHCRPPCQDLNPSSFEFGGEVLVDQSITMVCVLSVSYLYGNRLSSLRIVLS